MTVKLNSLARWSELAAGDGIVFEGLEIAERRVRIHFNLAARTAFYIHQAGEERFLCALSAGLETVEFGMPGTFTIFAEEGAGEVLYQSADLEPTFAEVVDPVIFTRIANRRHRNPELEEVMYRMQANMERRLAQQAGEIEAAFERRRLEMENGKPIEIVVSSAPGAVASAGGQEVQPQGATGENAGETATAPVGGQQPASAGGGQAGGAGGA